MGTVTLPNLSKTPAVDANDFADVYANDLAIITEVNGSLSATNLAANAVTTAKITDANVTDAKLASPNNSVYRLLLGGTSSYQPSAGVSSNIYLRRIGTTNFSGTVGAQGLEQMYFDDADFTVGGLTQKLRLRVQLEVAATSFAGLTLTFGVYQITGIAAGVYTFNATPVSGSTIAFAAPAANSQNQNSSGDFSGPSDGYYTVGAAITGGTYNGGHIFDFAAQLQNRSV